MRNRKLLGLASLLVGIAATFVEVHGHRATGSAPLSLALIIPVLLMALGLVALFWKPAPPVRREQAAYYVPGFSPEHASKNLAIEAGTHRLWIRDPDYGEGVVTPEDVLSWREERRDQTSGIAFDIRDGGAAKAWFVPFFRDTDIAPWLMRLQDALGERVRARQA